MARILSPEDFGIAATFWITTGVLAAVTELGLEKIIIQNERGDESYFGSVAQALLAIRGIFLACFILVFAPEIAAFFDAREAIGEFRLLALIPLMAGLQHRDLIRKQRTMDFKPLVYSLIVPEFSVTLLAYPAAVYFGDYRAFVYLALLSGIVRLFVSFMLAERPYVLNWDKAIVVQIIKFGWPLMINGLLMLLTLQGDKLVISQYYTKEELGFFVIAFGFATMVPNSLGQVTAQIVLPYLSRLKGDWAQLNLTLDYFNRILLLTSLAIIVVIFFHGEIITRLIYGERYLNAAVLVKIITVVFFIRLLRRIPNALAIAYADTWMVMASNIVRQVALIIALGLAIGGAELIWVASSGIAGEILAYITIAVLHRKKHGYSLDIWMKPLAAVVAITLLLVPLITRFNENDYFLYYLPVSVVVVITFAILVWKYLNELINANG